MSSACRRFGLAVVAVVVVAVGVVRAAPPAAEEEAALAKAEEESNRPEFELSLDYAGKYVSRGVVWTRDRVLQPAASVSWFGFTAGFWGNVDTTDVNGRDWDFSEDDFYVSYSHTLGPVTAEAGLQRYHYPTWGTTKEWYVTLALEEVPLSPSLTVAYEYDDANGVYINPAVEHSFPIKDWLALVLSGGVGWGDSDHNESYTGLYHGGWLDMTATATLEISVNDYVTVAPFVSWSDIIDRDQEEQVERSEDDGGLDQSSEQIWGGLSLRLCF